MAAAVVDAAGGHKGNLFKAVAHVADMPDREEIGRARHDFFGDPCPCSTLVQVAGLVFPELRV